MHWQSQHTAPNSVLLTAVIESIVNVAFCPGMCTYACTRVQSYFIFIFIFIFLMGQAVRTEWAELGRGEAVANCGHWSMTARLRGIEFHGFPVSRFSSFQVPEFLSF